MSLHEPAQPGEIIRELLLEPLRLSVIDAADHLGVSRKTFSRVINGRGMKKPQWEELI
jgi:addiction module HigA family antidote